MNKQDAIDVLRRHQVDLRAHGVIHAALFGSVARGEAGPKSDIDILIELDPDLKLDIFAYAGLKRYVAELFEGRVDVVNKEALKPHLRQPVSADVSRLSPRHLGGYQRT
jgi:predicted nucleotidyltransferase